jgi:hypothetical protein
MDAEQYERIREAVVVVVGRIKEMVSRFVENIKSITKTLAQLVIKHEEDKQKIKLLRQSWIVKRDTRRLSQVINNKPIHMPRIFY